MQAPSPLFAQLDLTGERPTVGVLMALCEENYRSLLRLAPRLSTAEGVLCSELPGNARLQLEVIEQAPYTTTLRLTHLFAPTGGRAEWLPEPDATLKAYHDAEQVEVLDLRQTALPIFSHYQSPALVAKWKANLFLAKWLSYCLYNGHRIASASERDTRTHRPSPSVV
jgi:uncharacterized protein YqiB (DUF1249 family)